MEKPQKFVGDCINAGLYIFSPPVLDRIEVRGECLVCLPGVCASCVYLPVLRAGCVPVCATGNTHPAPV